MTDSISAPAISDADVQAIHSLIRQASDAQNDPNALIPLHTPDAVIVNFFGRRILGRDAFDEAMRAALLSSLSDVTTSVEIIDIRPVTGSVALVSCVKTTHDQRDSADGAELPASTGALTYVVSRADDGWQIALAQTTPILS